MISFARAATRVKSFQRSATGNQMSRCRKFKNPIGKLLQSARFESPNPAIPLLFKIDPEFDLEEETDQTESLLAEPDWATTVMSPALLRHLMGRVAGGAE